MNDSTLIMTTSESLPLLTFTPTRQITFHVGPASTEVLCLDENGMTYKGQCIEDAGEAYAAFMEVMGRMRSSQAPA